MNALPADFLQASVSHRGLHDVANGRPENSCAACRAAMHHGYGIEIDLQLSSDGEAMVFHDYSLARLTQADGRLADLDASDLRRIGLTGGSEPIPSLDQVLGLVQGTVPMLIELKDQHGQMGQTDGRLEKATAAALRGYQGPVAVMSFNPHMVENMSRIAPQLPRGLVTCGYDQGDWPELPSATRAALRDIPDFDRVGACFISHHARDLDRPRVADLKTAGAAIFCWTIRSAEDEAQARRIADNVTFEGYLSHCSA